MGISSDKRVEALGKTAVYIAYCRSVENDREDALFKDPFAKDIAEYGGAEYFAEMAKVMSTQPDDAESTKLTMYGAVTVRTMIYDNLIKEGIERGVSQVVLCAVGGDSRSRRMDCLKKDGTRIFEMDFPDVLDFRVKTWGTNPNKGAVDVPVDFCERGAWVKALVDAGYDKTKPSVWIAEGLLMYLSIEEALDFIGGVSELTSEGSTFGGCMISSSFPTSPYTKRFHDRWAELGSPMRSGIDVPEEMMQLFGFADVKARQLGQEGAQFDRVPEKYIEAQKMMPPTQKGDGIPRNFMVTCRRMDKAVNAGEIKRKHLVDEAAAELQSLKKLLLPEHIRSIESLVTLLQSESNLNS